MYRPEYFAGVDEAGRGPLAGAVYAAAVVLNPFDAIEGLRDSKRLSAKRRRELDLEIRRRALACCIASANVREIDSINILQASLLAMNRAVRGLRVPVEFALVDGNCLPELPCRAEWLIGGDARISAVMAASIMAKVARDREMERLDRLYPQYGLARHKGYPTAAHLDALRRYGPSPVHRKSFRPCRPAPPES